MSPNLDRDIVVVGSVRLLYKFSTVAGERDCRLWSRIAPGMHEYARVCTGMRGYARVCAGMRGYARVYASTCAGVRKYAQNRNRSSRRLSAASLFLSYSLGAALPRSSRGSL